MKYFNRINSPMCILCKYYAAHQNNYVDKDGNLCCIDCCIICRGCNQRFLRDDDEMFICNHDYCNKCQEKCKCGNDYCSMSNVYTCNFDCMNTVLDRYVIRDISKIIYKYAMKSRYK